MTRTRRIALALALVAGWGAAPSARADFLATVAVAVAPEAGGWYRYEYTVDVGAASTLPAVQLDLAVSADADLQAIEAADGWSFEYDAAAGFISFFADAIDAPVVPGSSAAFAFLSRLAPVGMEYYLAGVDPPSFEVLDGLVAAPGVVVPEPSSVALLGAACLGLAGLAGLRRD